MSAAKKAVGDLDSMSVETLEREIRRHNRLYWEEQSPEISDYDYDRLVVRLEQLAPDSPVLLELGERKERLGEPVQHERPMLSLDKCYGEKELNDWAAKINGDFAVMPKLDGIACSVRYDAQGRLRLAATRGTGQVGDDITVNAREIKDIAKHVELPNVEVRGEIFMRLSVFDRFRDRFSNPRNLTAGAMKQKDAKKSAAYELSFAAYDVIGTGLETELEKFEWLEKQGFPKIEIEFVHHGELQSAYERYAEKRPTLDFEIDGIVFRANLVSEQSRLGLTAHHPRYSIAYKFQGESGRTRLKDVEWSVSRTGAITPVAIVEPVQLSGAQVSRASLHHAGYVRNLDLTRDCEVLVTRRGGVIPHIEEVIKAGGEHLRPPKHCPSCGSPTRAEGDFLFCSTPQTCKASKLGEIEHYCTVTEMLGFGERILDLAWESHLVRSPVDLYTLTAEDLSKLERVGEKLAQKLIGQVDARRRLPLAVFLRALGVPELGSHVSALLADRYGTLERVRELTVEELANVHSVGEVIARSVIGGLAERAELIDALLKHVTIEAPKKVAQDGPLHGLSFVFTGRLEAMDRKVAQQAVRGLGAETPSAVSSHVTHLVTGIEKDGAKSTKQKSAEKLNAKGAGIEILDEAAFLRLLENARGQA